MNITEASGTITEDTEIVVEYTSKSYTVTIHYQDANGETLFDDVVISDLKYGDTYRQVSPEHETLTPDQATVDGKITETTAETTEITVNYSEDLYSLTVYLDGEMNREGKLVKGSNLELPVCDQSGYVYKWYTDAERTTEFTSTTMPGADTTICGYKTAVEYTATFVASGTTVDTVVFTVETESIEAPAVPARGTNVVGKWEPYTLGTENITVNAVYAVTGSNQVATKNITGFNVWTGGVDYFEVPNGAFDVTASFDFSSNTNLGNLWETWGMQIGSWVLRGDKYSWWDGGNSAQTPDVYKDINGAYINPAQGHAEITIQRVGAESTIKVTIKVTSGADSYTYQAVKDMGNGAMGIGFGGENVTITDYTRTHHYNADQKMPAYVPSAYCVTVGEGDFTVKYKFHQKSEISGNAYYMSWCVTISPDWVLRADYFSNVGQAGTSYGPYVDWEDYVSIYQNATVEVTISRTGNVVTVNATALGANGKSIAYSATKTLNSNATFVSLGADHCTIEMLSIAK